jgi:hypothetical protein
LQGLRLGLESPDLRLKRLSASARLFLWKASSLGVEGGDVALERRTFACQPGIVLLRDLAEPLAHMLAKG